MRWRKILIIICLGIFLYSAYQIAAYLYDNYKSESTYDKIREEYEKQLEQEKEASLTTDQPSNNPNTPVTPNTPKPNTPNLSGKRMLMDRYNSLLEINKDVVGWISVPNTVIGYPVVQADDNDFYLRRNIHGERATAGTIFMDYRSDARAEGKHIILYGHHMRNGSMFKDLVKYKEEDFFRNQGNIRFNTLYEEIEWEVFSIYVADADFNYRQTEFTSGENYIKFLKKLQNESMFNKGIELTENDQILTLSTCTYEYDDARFVVHARRTDN